MKNVKHFVVVCGYYANGKILQEEISTYISYGPGNGGVLVIRLVLSSARQLSSSSAAAVVAMAASLALAAAVESVRMPCSAATVLRVPRSSRAQTHWISSWFDIRPTTTSWYGTLHYKHRQTNRHTDKHTDRQTDTHPGIHDNTLTSSWPDLVYRDRIVHSKLGQAVNVSHVYVRYTSFAGGF